MHRGEPDMVNVISGKLCYLKMVKGENDPVYSRLNAQFLRLTKDANKAEQQGNIDYLFTMSKTDFEKKLGVTIDFASRKDDQKPYGTFTFQGRRFVVAVSKNLDVNNLPDSVQISLTRMLIPVEYYRNPYDTLPSDVPTKSRMGYLLHKTLRNYRPEAIRNLRSETVTSELEDIIIRLASTFPELELKDDMGILDSYNRDNLLSRLVESDFDLSIL